MGQVIDRIELEAVVENVSTARRFVRQTLTDVPADVVSDLQLATSELVTNAIEHGASDSIVIEVRIDDDRASVSVQSDDARATIGSAATWAVAPIDATSGRGLGIVKQIADALEVERVGSALTITAHRNLAESEPR